MTAADAAPINPLADVWRGDAAQALERLIARACARFAIAAHPPPAVCALDVPGAIFDRDRRFTSACVRRALDT